MDPVGVIIAPVRIGVRVGRDAVTLAVRGVGAVAGVLRGDPEHVQRAAPREADAAPPGPTVEPPRPPATPPPPPTSEAPPEPEAEAAEPAHVDEGATLVGEFAEPGAEDGAGAELELSEPWEGYDEMQVDELLPRLGDASSETLAAVVLYERSTRDRAAVVDEAELQLRRRNAPEAT
jgi:hypothetical protein